MAGRILPAIERVQGFNGSATEGVVSPDNRQDDVTKYFAEYDMTTKDLNQTVQEPGEKVDRCSNEYRWWSSKISRGYIIRTVSTVSATDALFKLEAIIKSRVGAFETCLDLIEEEVYTKRFEEQVDQMFPD
jgi:hypothetical protein